MTLSSATEDPVAIYNKLPFAIDENSFNQWFRDLDIANKAQTFKLLFSTLHVMAKEEIPAKSRFLFVQKLSLLVEQISEEFQATYIRNHFPFSSEDNLTLELSARCAMQITRNYVLLCEDSSFKVNSSFTPQQKALILFNAIHAQSKVLLYKSFLYEKPKKGFWRLCSSFYLLAKKNDVINLAIDGQGTCFINKFKQLLMFELSNVQQFTTEEILSVFRLLNNVSDQAQLLTKVPEKKFKGIPSLDLRKDEPPSLSNKEYEQEQPYIFYISALNVIKRLIGALSDKRIPADCNKAMFLRLIKTLTMNQQRKTDRELASGEFFAVIGFDEIEAFILDNKKKQAGYTERALDDDLGGLKSTSIQKIDDGRHRLPSDEFKNELQANFAIAIADDIGGIGKINSSDIWGASEDELLAQEQLAQKPVENAEFLDKSTSGFQLCLKDEKLAIKVGDIIGLIMPETLVITVIRRIIQALESETLVGVETLGDFSGLLHIINTDNKGAIWVLYLNRNEETESIIIKTEDFNNEAYLFADNNEKITKYRVEKQLNASAMIKHLKVSQC